MMGAVAAAARAGGAHTLGVIPQALVGWEVADDDADELVVTPDMRARKATMDERSDAFVALPGGIGTLEELLEIWVARSLGMHAKPVVVLDPDGTYAGLRGRRDLAGAARLRAGRGQRPARLDHHRRRRRSTWSRPSSPGGPGRPRCPAGRAGGAAGGRGGGRAMTPSSP